MEELLMYYHQAIQRNTQIKKICYLFNDYFHLVPFVEDDETGTIFLKTIIPSRKLKINTKLKFTGALCQKIIYP